MQIQIYLKNLLSHRDVSRTADRHGLHLYLRHFTCCKIFVFFNLLLSGIFFANKNERII